MCSSNACGDPPACADGTDLRIGQVGFQGLNLLGGAHCATAPSLPSPTNGFRGIGGSPKAIVVRGTDRDAGDQLGRNPVLQAWSALEARIAKRCRCLARGHSWADGPRAATAGQAVAKLRCWMLSAPDAFAAAASPRCRSAIRSSTSSMPTERRTRLAGISSSVPISEAWVISRG